VREEEREREREGKQEEEQQKNSPFSLFEKTLFPFSPSLSQEASPSLPRQR
jgi:hypothetical protein